jgi:Na+-driven multidrug efflux pump
LKFYTKDKEVIELAKDVLQIYLAFTAIVELQMDNLCGAIRGLGK